MSLSRHLVVFAKAPVLGTVKTRLAADIGFVGATAFYRRTLSGLMTRLGHDRRWRTWVAVSPDTAALPNVYQQSFWPSEAGVLKQGPGDLGQRMGRVFKTLPPGPVVLIGADIPAIMPRHIENAFRALGQNDTVLGPAHDGGYWLVGARRSPRVPDLFSGIPWSTDRTLSDTLDKINAAGFSSTLLQTLDDIDDGTAYLKWIRGALSGEA